MTFESRFGQCPMFYTLSILGGKWKWVLLWKIHENETLRYGELRRALRPIAHKTLSQQLKELEEDGLLHRRQYDEMPPRVEYSLTEKGATLIPLLQQMYDWGRMHGALK